MSAMHAGVMTTSTEMMYAQHVTLTVRRPYSSRAEFHKQYYSVSVSYTHLTLPTIYPV